MPFARGDRAANRLPGVGEWSGFGLGGNPLADETGEARDRGGQDEPEAYRHSLTLPVHSAGGRVPQWRNRSMGGRQSPKATPMARAVFSRS